MKQEQMIVFGLAAVAVYLITQSKKPGTASGGLAKTASTVKEIFDTAGKVFDNGWRYFTDGTAIDPQGNYYQGGQLIWTNRDIPNP